MKNEEIVEIIKSIIFTRLQISQQECENNAFLLDQPLTGESWGLTNIDMTYLLFEIEQYFNITIPSEKLLQYGFITVNKIAHIVALQNK